MECGAGVFVWEVDLAYTPELFEPGDNDVDFVDNSNATTWMANVILGLPVGGQRGTGFRGDARYFRALADPTEDNEFGIDFGDFDFWRGTVGVSFRRYGAT